MENELNKWNTFVHENYKTLYVLVNKSHEAEFKLHVTVASSNNNNNMAKR